MRTFNAHFDGKIVVLEEPTGLEPNSRVKVFAPDPAEAEGNFGRLSDPVFRKIWDNPLDADYDNL